jgi:hypothetical protein
MHGCSKIELKDGESYWGEFKDHKREGYGTELFAYGEKYIGQFM